MIEGRDDDMLITGGENVFPAEIEALLTDHPAIDQAVVVGLPDDEFGQRLAAAVVAVPGATITPDEVRSHVREHLARFKVPREVTVVDELPRNPSAQVVHHTLEEPDLFLRRSPKVLHEAASLAANVADHGPEVVKLVASGNEGAAFIDARQVGEIARLALEPGRLLFD